MANWSKPIAIPNQTSKTTPTLAVIHGVLHMIHLGASSDRLWYSFWNGVKWSDNETIGGKESSGRVALGQDGLLVYQSKEIGSAGARGLVYSLFQGGWPPSKPLPDNPTTADASSVALSSSGKWWVARRVPNTGSRLALAQYGFHAAVPPAFSTVDLIFSEEIEERSEKVPTLVTDSAGFLNLIYLREGTKELWHSRAGNNQPIRNQSSRDVPAAALHGNTLHMVHIGAGSDTIWHSTSDGFGWTDNVPIPDHASNKPPAIASASDGLHMVHKGAGSDRLWHSIYS